MFKPDIPLYTDEDVRRLLTEACDAAGGQSAVARAFGVSRNFIHLVLAGRELATPPMLTALGLRRMPRLYTPIGEPE